jgi:hypothetical protein
VTCGACHLAEIRPTTGHYLHGCKECDARKLAHSAGFAASMAAGKFRSDYRDALRSIAGDDADRLHQAVKAWDQKIRGAT